MPAVAVLLRFPRCAAALCCPPAGCTGEGGRGGEGEGATLLNVLFSFGPNDGKKCWCVADRRMISELALPEELQFTNPLLRRWLARLLLGSC